jgi:hypothetical protein
MTLAFSTRGWGADVAPARIVAHAHALDVHDVHLSEPIPQAGTAFGQLRAGGVRVVSVAPALAGDEATFPQALAQAGVCASRVRARAVVVDGGRTGADREAAADGLVRSLHGPLRAGVPLALRNGADAQDLLGFEEIEWLLSEVPTLGFWFDPFAADQRHRMQAGPATQTWVDAYAGRVAGVFVHGGAGEGNRGGSHPTEGGPDWGTLVAALPRGVPWILDLDARLGVGDAADAVRWLRSSRG